MKTNKQMEVEVPEEPTAERKQRVLDMTVGDLMNWLREGFVDADDSIVYRAGEVIEWMAHSDIGTATKLPTTPRTTPRHIAVTGLEFSIETAIDLMPDLEPAV